MSKNTQTDQAQDADPTIHSSHLQNLDSTTTLMAAFILSQVAEEGVQHILSSQKPGSPVAYDSAAMQIDTISRHVRASLNDALERVRKNTPKGHEDDFKALVIEVSSQDSLHCIYTQILSSVFKALSAPDNAPLHPDVSHLAMSAPHEGVREAQRLRSEGLDVVFMQKGQCASKARWEDGHVSLPVGTLVSMLYKGQKFMGSLQAGHAIKVGDTTYSTLSAAANALATGVKMATNLNNGAVSACSLNGWNYWRIMTEKGEGQTLAALRAQALRAKTEGNTPVHGGATSHA